MNNHEHSLKVSYVKKDYWAFWVENICKFTNTGKAIAKFLKHKDALIFAKLKSKELEIKYKDETSKDLHEMT